MTPELDVRSKFVYKRVSIFITVAAKKFDGLFYREYESVCAFVMNKGGRTQDGQ